MKIFDRLKSIIKSSLSQIRVSKVLPDLKLIQNCIEMFIDTGLFDSFEKDLLEATKRDLSAQFDTSFRSHQKIKLLIFNILFEEQLFTSLGLPKETLQQLVKTIEEITLNRHIEPLVIESIPVLMECFVEGNECANISEPPNNHFEPFALMNDQYLHLKLLSWLSRKSNTMEELKRQWSKYIKAHGAKLLQSSTINDQTSIEKLLKFKLQLEQVLENVFDHDSAFEMTMKESFETCINTHEVLVASLLAKYFDVLLKDGKPASASEKLTEQTMSETVGNLVQIFRMLTSKDVFEAHYKEYLASRLILTRSFSIDLEKDVVSRFKLECGASFTSRFEGMFKDMDASTELWNGFRQHLKEPELVKTKIDFNTTVISSGIWPHPENVNAQVPSIVAVMETAYLKYYDEKHDGRILTWNHALGSVILKADFPQGSKELQLSIPQALILMAFSDEDRLTCSIIQKKTALSEHELQEALISLSEGRHQVLVRETKEEGGLVKKNEFFVFNDAFNSRLFRIRMNTYGTKETFDAKVVSGIIPAEDRQHQIDAAIVRLLKAERRKSFKEVLSTVKSMLNDTVKEADIDRRIESLIERDFVAKDKENLSYLLYVS